MGTHLVVLHRAVRGLPGYDPLEATSIGLAGASIERGSEHGRAVAEQVGLDHGTLRASIEAGEKGLRAAGVPRRVRKQARKAAEDYFYAQLELSPATELTKSFAPARVGSALPEPMYLALRDLFDAIVERRYHELSGLSGNRLAVEDLRRRIDDAALTMPPRDQYVREAVTQANEREWFFFLDLWSGEDAAGLHATGELTELDDGRMLARLDDIAP